MKKVKIDEELLNALQTQLQAFRQKFAREPEPGDPIFFDPDANANEPRFPSDQQIKAMREQMYEIMREAQMPPAIIYAYEKTGRIVTQENKRFLTRADLKEWNCAIEEYYSQN